jgi:hypothetical protein
MRRKNMIDKDLYGSLKGKPNKGPAGLQVTGGDLSSRIKVLMKMVVIILVMMSS